MSKIIKVDGVPLLLFTLPQGGVPRGPLIETYELARILGYTQQSSVRKQILTDWKKHVWPEKDYVLVQGHRALEKYDKEHIDLIGPIKAVKLTRGRLFLAPSGLSKVLARTSKDTSKLQDALVQEGFLKLEPQLEKKPDELVKDPSPSGSVLQPLVDLKHSLIETRRFNYEVLQTLLTQLNELQDDDLKLLAIEAAEIALGRSQPDLRAKYTKPAGVRSPSTSPSNPAPPVVQKLGTPDGPVFTKEGFYGLKQIGEMAGGYTSVTAGKAANNVAEAIGHSADEIRSKQLDFNELPVLPDSSTGKPRRMYRFNLMFSNMVIRELRENPQFVPRDGPMPLTSFSSGARSNLNRGPLDESPTN